MSQAIVVMKFLDGEYHYKYDSSRSKILYETYRKLKILRGDELRLDEYVSRLNIKIKRHDSKEAFLRGITEVSLDAILDMPDEEQNYIGDII